MRRDPLIIHLYDKPHARRSYARRCPAPPDYGSAALSCAAIALFAGLFFWAYDATVHHEAPFVAAPIKAAALHHSGVASRLIPPEAPAPDLDSPAVLLANADVPAAPAEAEDGLAKGSEKAAAVQPKPAAVPARKRRTYVARKLRPEAAQAQASAPGYFSLPFGGF